MRKRLRTESRFGLQNQCSARGGQAPKPREGRNVTPEFVLCLFSFQTLSSVCHKNDVHTGEASNRAPESSRDGPYERGRYVLCDLVIKVFNYNCSSCKGGDKQGY